MNDPRARLALLRTGLLAAALLAGGCDYLGVESATDKAAARDAEGKAVGSACRHAGRALEDCYAYNPTASKAAVFSGWKSMNDYMAENKLDTIKPVVEPRLPQPKRKPGAAAPADAQDAASRGEPGPGDSAGRDAKDGGKDPQARGSGGGNARDGAVKSAATKRLDPAYDAPKAASTH